MYKFYSKATLFISLFVICSKLDAQTTTDCLKIESILVDACANTIFVFPIGNIAAEGDNEMVRFLVGSNDLNLNEMTVNWPGAYTWAGVRFPDNVTAQKTAELNATVQSCGILVEPINGVLPANSKVLLIASYTPSATQNSFADLSDTLYVVYQNSTGRWNGHVLNYQANPTQNDQTVTINFGPDCSSSATYLRNLLINQNGLPGAQDGAIVLFDANGNASYINNGCQAPVVTLSPVWSLPSGNGLLCANDNAIDLNNLVTGTQGGIWSGIGVEGSFFNPLGLNGTFEITYTVGQGICSEQSTQTITVNQPVNPEWNPPSELCLSQSTTIQLIDFITGTNGGTFSGPGVQNNIFDGTGLSGLVDITYNVGIGTCNVSSTKSILVINIAPPTISTDQTKYCGGEIPFPINALGLSGSNIFWYNDEPLNNVVGSGDSFLPILNESFVYYAVQELGNCRSLPDSITITYYPAPESPAGPLSYSICPGEAMPQVTFQNTEIINWFLDEALTEAIFSGNSFTPDQGVNTLYILISNVNCDSEPYTINIEQLEFIDVSITLEGNEVLCNNETARLISSSIFENLWSTGENTQEITVDQTGWYIVNVNGQCNTAVDSIFIENQAVIADFTATPTIGNVPFNVFLNNLSTNADEFFWFQNENSIIPVNNGIIINEAGDFEIMLIVTNQYGCSDTAFQEVKGLNDLVEFNIPNSFTPNGDGFNDFFKVQASGIVSFKGVIYNRWGQPIYEWAAVEQGWDGTVSGKSSPDGVYFYIISAKDFQGNEILKQGDITVIR